MSYASGKPDCGTFVAEGTKWQVKEWLKITHNPWVISAIKGVKIEFNEVPVQMSEPEPYRMSGEKQAFVDLEIQTDLINAGAYMPP